MIKLIIFFIIHIIGFIVFTIICYKDGSFDYAVEYGDGIRIATPLGVLFYCFLWEIFWPLIVISIT